MCGALSSERKKDLSPHECWEWLQTAEGDAWVRNIDSRSWLCSEEGFAWKQELLRAHREASCSKPVRIQRLNSLTQGRQSALRRATSACSQDLEVRPWTDHVGMAKKTLIDEELIPRPKVKSFSHEALLPSQMSEKIRSLSGDAVDGFVQALFDVHSEYYAFWAYSAFHAYNQDVANPWEHEVCYPWLTGDDADCAGSFALLGTSLPNKIFVGISPDSHWWNMLGEQDVVNDLFGTAAKRADIADVFDIIKGRLRQGICPTLHAKGEMSDHPIFHPEWEDSLTRICEWLRADR